MITTKKELEEILQRVGSGETTVEDERILREVLIVRGATVDPFEPLPPETHDQAKIDEIEREVERHQKLPKKGDV